MGLSNGCIIRWNRVIQKVIIIFIIASAEYLIQFTKNLFILLLLSPSTKDPNKAVTGVSLAGDPRGWLGLQSRGVRFVGLRGGRDLVVVVWKGSLAGMGTQAR